MNDEIEAMAFNAMIQKVNDVFTEEALKANDGKTIPLRREPGGPIIGEATLKYDANEQALKADFQFDDPRVAELLRGSMPPVIFKKEN